jgi:hypothetical protein
MPGIYVNDGGQTSSAIGSILGNLATNLGPEAAAKAQLLKLQSEEADRQNALLSNIQQGANAIPAYLTAPGVNADPTVGVGDGTVAGTLANAAQPPAWTPFTRDQTAGFSPFARIMAGSYSKDPSMANVATGVNLGRSGALGPGQDYPTQADIIKAKSVPYDTTVGLTHHVPGGALPETTTSGGDSVAQGVDIEQRKNDIADANKRAELAQTAAQQINENSRLLNIYNTLVNSPGSDDTLSILGDQAFKDLASFPLMGDATKLSSRLGAMEAIQARLGNSISNQLKTVQGPNDVPVRGVLQTITPPDPTKLDPDSFRAAMEQYQRVLQYQKDEGPIAEDYRNSNYGKADGDTYRARLKAHSDAVFNREREEAKPPAPVPAQTTPPSPASVAHLRAHPETAADFDKRYGPGAARKVLGQ